MAGQYSATAYQVTSYGLGGMVEEHLDAYGYNEGAELTEDRQQLVNTGDTIATLMAWLSDTTTGGATTFFKTKV